MHSHKKKKRNQNVKKKKKAPGLDLIIARTLKELPKEGPVNLMNIFSAIQRLEYWPKSLNTE